MSTFIYSTNVYNTEMDVHVMPFVPPPFGGPNVQEAFLGCEMLTYIHIIARRKTCSAFSSFRLLL